MSFGHNDAIVIDWNAALLFDVAGEDVLAVLEWIIILLIAVSIAIPFLPGLSGH